MPAKSAVPKRSKKVDSVILYELVLQGTQSMDVEVRAAADSVRSVLVLQLKSPKVVLPPPMIPFYKTLLKYNTTL